MTTLGQVEPRGHQGELSKLERFWLASSEAQSLERRRVRRFDSAAGMSFAPMEYAVTPFVISSSLPSAEWVRTTVGTFVRGEFPAQQINQASVPPEPKVVEQVVLPDDFLDDFLLRSELVDLPRLDPSTGLEDDIAMAAATFELLCNAKIGSKRNLSHNVQSEFIERVVPTIARESRLLFVLPGFPFKDQNRFRVPFDGDEPDLAEIAFLVRLHRLTQALYQVHPFGVDVVILTDGTLYADIFGVMAEVAERYALKMRAIRNRLNLQGTISFISLQEMVERAAPNATLIIESVEELLRGLIRSDSGTGIIFEQLVNGMKRNMESRRRLGSLDAEAAWSVLGFVPDSKMDDKKLERIAEGFDRDARTAALRYASVNLMLRWTNLIDRYFPGAIRGTVHPKPGQFALAGSGGAYAWNGVAWASRWPRTIDDVLVRPFSALDQLAVRQYIFPSGAPAFFTKVDD